MPSQLRRSYQGDFFKEKLWCSARWHANNYKARKWCQIDTWMIQLITCDVTTLDRTCQQSKTRNSLFWKLFNIKLKIRISLSENLGTDWLSSWWDFGWVGVEVGGGGRRSPDWARQGCSTAQSSRGRRWWREARAAPWRTAWPDRSCHGHCLTAASGHPPPVAVAFKRKSKTVSHNEGGGVAWASDSRSKDLRFEPCVRSTRKYINYHNINSTSRLRESLLFFLLP